MKDQPELFDSARYEKGEHKTPEPDHIMARRTDPMSSLVAAEEAMMSGRRDTQARDVLRAVIRYPHKTSRELASVTGMDRYIVARRLPELEKDGLVMKEGNAAGPVLRKCTVSGRPAVTWIAVTERKTET